MPAKAEIFNRLQREIHSLQGYKSVVADGPDFTGLGPINHAFANAEFPLSALHEFVCHTAEEATASMAFISGIISMSLKRRGIVIWICTTRFIFPPALMAFRLPPEQVIFLYLKKEKDILWAVEEALKCNTLTAVIGDVDALSLTASRRLQLAIEKSGVGCFLLRQNAFAPSTTAVARWHIKPVSSLVEEGLPGIGHPQWQVTLLKVRNGKPGTWQVGWMDGRFTQVPRLAAILPQVKKKTG